MHCQSSRGMSLCPVQKPSATGASFTEVYYNRRKLLVPGEYKPGLKLVMFATMPFCYFAFLCHDIRRVCCVDKA